MLAQLDLFAKVPPRRPSKLEERARLKAARERKRKERARIAAEKKAARERKRKERARIAAEKKAARERKAEAERKRRVKVFPPPVIEDGHVHYTPTMDRDSTAPGWLDARSPRREAGPLDEIATMGELIESGRHSGRPDYHNYLGALGGVTRAARNSCEHPRHHVKTDEDRRRMVPRRWER